MQPFIDEASDRFGVPEAWIRAVIRAESGGRTTVNGQPITSRAGALPLPAIQYDKETFKPAAIEPEPLKSVTVIKIPELLPMGPDQLG